MGAEALVRRQKAHYGAAFFSIAATGLCVAALLTNEWYNITAPGQLVVNYGVIRNCTQGASCTTLEFPDFTSGTCTRKGSEMKSRTYAVFGLVIGGGAFALFTFLLVLASHTRRALGFLSAFCAIIAMGALAAASVLYPFTWHHWYFCDKAFCANIVSGTCSAFFGFSFAIELVAAASTVISAVLSIVVVCFYLPPPTVTVAAPVEAGVHVVDNNGTDVNDAHSVVPAETRYEDRGRRVSEARTPQQDNRNSAAGVAENRRTTEMRALTSTTNNQSLDGWELDENTGLYWSDREKLFYDPISGHFYDPESELWYDPTTEQWYQGAEQ
ncbi:transmembrane protein, putative [Bodo saltans]|uniref:Transmembrane protein, putative n=1 Tax=Bodo saltans TaxID=75058 RepID=A0A0S4IYH3_BODSA|nr:transmembrane protein, putative [Bodo saltans]|eukprot:CUG01359.1 transmembrane protein, putative [Bodo saltans]